MSRYRRLKITLADRGGGDATELSGRFGE